MIKDNIVKEKSTYSLEIRNSNKIKIKLNHNFIKSLFIKFAITLYILHIFEHKFTKKYIWKTANLKMQSLKS